MLEGDFDFKVARQDYYLTKQKRMLRHLTAQQARHKFLVVAMDAETTMMEKLQNILSATTAEMNSFKNEMESRQDEIEHLSKLQSIDQRQTVDERDTFTRRLNCMLDGTPASKMALASSTETAAMVKKMQGVKDGHEAEQNQIDQRRGRTTLKLEELVRTVEALIFPEMDGMAVNTPKEFASLCARLSAQAEQLTGQVTGLHDRIENSFESLALQPSARHYEKQLYCDYFNAPHRLQVRPPGAT